MFASTVALLLCSVATPQSIDAGPPSSLDADSLRGPTITDLRGIINNIDVCQSNAPIQLCGTGTYWGNSTCEPNLVFDQGDNGSLYIATTDWLNAAAETVNTGGSPPTDSNGRNV